nr:MAG TPA: hypothetical protein [Caudoviricetes sp.]
MCYIRSHPGKGLTLGVWYTARVLRCNSGEPGIEYLELSMRRGSFAGKLLAICKTAPCREIQKSRYLL